jgi:hypothetical protein
MTVHGTQAFEQIQRRLVMEMAELAEAEKQTLRSSKTLL